MNPTSLHNKARAILAARRTKAFALNGLIDEQLHERIAKSLYESTIETEHKPNDNEVSNKELNTCPATPMSTRYDSL